MSTGLIGRHAAEVEVVSRQAEWRAIAVGKPTTRKRRGKVRGDLGRAMVVVALAAVGLAVTRGMNPMHLGALRRSSRSCSGCSTPA